MSASRWFQSASVSLVMTFTLGVAVGFSLCYALMVVTGEDGESASPVSGTVPTAQTGDAATRPSVPRPETLAATTAPEPAAPPTPAPAPTVSAPPVVPPPAPAPMSSPPPATQEEMERLWPARQLFVTLPAGPIDPAWAALLKAYRPGGVVVTSPDSAHGADVAATIRQAKEAVGMGVSQSDLPLAVIGQEGGANNPLGVNPAPSPRELGEAGDENGLRETALRHAGAARTAGAAALLGPRLDLASAMNDHSNLCFGAAPDLVSEAGIVFARAVAEGGVLPIVMHYPGTGTAVRTASGPPVVAETNLDALTDIMLPFANAAAEQLPGILVGCVTVPMLDKNQTGRPACASPVMVQGILRDKWAYQGVVLADVSQPALADPVALDVFVTNCLAAGCDAVLLGTVSPAQFEQICRTLTVALRDGALVTDRMAAARARLASWSLALKMEVPASEKNRQEPPAPAPITDVTPVAPQPAPAPAPEPAPAPVLEATPAAVPAPPTGGIEHTIAPGETLDGIAKKYGVSMAEVIKQNDLKNTNSIRAGAKLKIQPPATVETPEPPAPPEPAPIPEPAPVPEPVPVPEAPAPAVVQEATPAPEAPAAPATPVEAPKAEEQVEPANAAPAATPPAPPQETKTEEAPAMPAPATAVAETPAIQPTPTPTPTPAPAPASDPAPAPEPTSEPTSEPATAPVAPAGVVEHTIAPGETLEGIAKKYGVSMADVIKENGLKDTNNIQAGAKLKIQPLAATEAPKQAATPEAPAVPEPTGSAAQEPAPEVKPDATPVPEAAPTEAPAPAQEETAAVPETPQAAPEAETADAPAAEGEYEYHVVQQGENLYRLAINCGTTKEELMRLNDLKDVTLVKVGARLKVPKKKP